MPSSCKMASLYLQGWSKSIYAEPLSAYTVLQEQRAQEMPVLFREYITGVPTLNRGSGAKA